jgi:hypothetical protein
MFLSLRGLALDCDPAQVARIIVVCIIPDPYHRNF